MKEFFRKQRYKFQQFMVGRYGVDKLYRALLIFFFVFTILANLFYRVSKITYYAFEVMGFVLLVYAFFRVFSKNIEARRQENAAGFNFGAKLKAFSNFKTINSSSAKLINS